MAKLLKKSFTPKIGDASLDPNLDSDSISKSQLEYTAGRIFVFGTISVAVIAVYAAIIYMGVQQLKK